MVKLSEIRERSVVNGGQIILKPLDLPDGTEVEVNVLVEKETDKENGHDRVFAFDRGK